MNSDIKKNDVTTYYTGGELTAAIHTELDHWQAEDKVNRLWRGDKTLWTNQDENNWIGWLALPEPKNKLSELQAFANEIQESKIKDVILLGMGGSSLCPLMFAEIFGKIDDCPRLHVLDSTDPDYIIALETKIDLKNSLFIVSSKSGTTLEPNIFFDYFYKKLQLVLPESTVGNHFIAITDPKTPLAQLAQEKKFKAIFYGIPSIGGRYSALSNFGMVPLSLMGINIMEFSNNINEMHEACAPNIKVANNPGVVLGCVLGVAANHGKNKVTLLTTPGIKSLGAWLEQLIAESTGKQGKGMIPIDQEPLAEPSRYNNDRVFIYIILENDLDLQQNQKVVALEQAGFIVVRLHIANKMDLGAELFRWEIAIAAAGSIIGINPFNQPDVEESKLLTLQFAAEYEKTGHFTQNIPFHTEDNISLFTDKEILQMINNHLNGKVNLKNYIKAFLHLAHKNDYINFSAFISDFNEYLEELQNIRVMIRDKTKIATCLGFGPRFLHSTGQAYKGGPNTGLFFQITTVHKNDLQIPSHRYTFGSIITAQAEADFNVLANHKRRIMRIHFLENLEQGLHHFKEMLD